MLNLLLVSNLDGTFAGSLDVPMTDLGRDQVQKTAEYLKDWKIDVAFASPLSRSIEVSVSNYVKAGANPPLDSSSYIERQERRPFID